MEKPDGEKALDIAISMAALLEPYVTGLPGQTMMLSCCYLLASFIMQKQPADRDALATVIRDQILDCVSHLERIRLEVLKDQGRDLLVEAPKDVVH